MAQFMLMLNHAPDRYQGVSADEYMEIIKDYVDWVERQAAAGVYVGGEKLADDSDRARNCAIDRLRRERRELPFEPEVHDRTDAHHDGHADALFAARISDPELRLMLLCCHPALSEPDRIAMTLRVACGFSNREIAGLFLLPEGTLGQRLADGCRRYARTAGNRRDCVIM